MKNTVTLLSSLVVVLTAILSVMLIYFIKIYNSSENNVNNDISQSSMQSQTAIQSEKEEVVEQISFNEKLISAREHNSLQSEESLTFELPINGAMGFPSVNAKLYSDENLSKGGADYIGAGQPLVIKKEINGTVWKVVSKDGKEGYISNKNCFINLPDIVPSIVFNITNSSSSIFLSSGKEIPEITGEKLFDFYFFNERYGEDEYVAPVLYTMAKKIYNAQVSALSEGNTLVIYETYRPYDAQMAVAKALKTLSSADKEVKAGLSKSPWSLNWFIATQLSTHQKGCAIDVSLAMVNNATVKDCGNYKYLDIDDFTEYEMQTDMHELSVNAVALKFPVNGNSADAWRKVENSPLMTEGAVLLKKYCTDSGMSPLASEWWHFNDLEAVKELGRNYRLDYNFSVNISQPVEVENLNE